MKTSPVPSGLNSLRPDASLIEAAAQGHPVAICIRDAWKFSLPIRHVAADDPVWQRETLFLG
jgi:hypothetical protein